MEGKGAPERRHEILGTALLLIAVYLVAAIAAGPGDPAARSCLDAHARAGPVGSCLRMGAVDLIGLPATWLI
ncbi:MAG TPA: hypothetical protein VMS45_04920, partial [Gemmatimonadaceae bacterium]|nr:hypothetical protein [Gemmatimonadaceae bacterium]